MIFEIATTKVPKQIGTNFSHQSKKLSTIKEKFATLNVKLKNKMKMNTYFTCKFIHDSSEKLLCASS